MRIRMNEYKKTLLLLTFSVSEALKDNGVSIEIGSLFAVV